jgi:L-lactate dehydrogenase complex protein LldG
VSEARESILRAVRAARPADVPLPDVRAAIAAFDRPAAAPADALVARFVEVARAGGSGVIEGARADVASLARSAYPQAERIVSATPAVAGTMPFPEDRRRLANVDLFVCEGVLGVAENGAVWLPASRLVDRAALFLATAVVVVLDRAAIVPDLHAAYARLDVAAEPFGAFVAGPSKTADIEQSLVVGAHGPKGLTVLLLSSS